MSAAAVSKIVVAAGLWGKTITLAINGKETKIETGKVVEVSDAELSALAGANAEYEVVEASKRVDDTPAAESLIVDPNAFYQNDPTGTGTAGGDPADGSADGGGPGPLTDVPELRQDIGRDGIPPELAAIAEAAAAETAAAVRDGAGADVAGAPTAATAVAKPAASTAGKTKKATAAKA